MSRKSLSVALATMGVAGVLAGCGSSTGGDPASATRTATAVAQDPTSTITAVPTTAAPSEGPSEAPSAAAPTAAPAAAASVAPAGSSALPGVPAVQNATDLTKQPIAAAGTGAAPTGLVTRDLVVGSGTAAVATDTVHVRYAGTLYTDGSSFDASWTDGAMPDKSNTFPLNGVVPGFAQGIEGMKPGGRREIVIPSALGYGPDGSPPKIPANATLVFIVDYLGLGAAS